MFHDCEIARYRVKRANLLVGRGNDVFASQDAHATHKPTSAQRDQGDTHTPDNRPWSPLRLRPDGAKKTILHTKIVQNVAMAAVSKS